MEGERGVVLTFGEYASETGSGLRWHAPWPIQSHQIVNLSQVRTIEVGYRNNNVKLRNNKEALMLTDDENIVSVQFAVQYVVTDAKDWLFSNRRPEETAMQAAESAMREVIGRSKMDGILYESRAQINIAAQKLMQQILDRYKTGILVSTVTIQAAQPPEQVQASFSDAQNASQDRERQKNEGQAYANDVIPKARGTASRLMQEADGYKQRVIASADGDALALQADPRRIRQGAGGDARADLPRHDAADHEHDLEDHAGLQGRRQPAVPAARQADAAGRGAVRGSRGDAARSRRRTRRRRRTPRRVPARRCASAAGGSGRESREGTLMKVLAPIVAALIALALLASSALFTVDQRQNAIVFQLGEVKDVITKPGLHFKWPLLQNVRFFDMRILAYDDPEPLGFLTSRATSR